MTVTESAAPAKPERWTAQWKELYSEVITTGLCTGCAGCVVTCPHDVIGYEHEEGKYIPFHLEEELGLDDSVAVGVPFWGTYAYDSEAATDYYPDDGGVGYYSFGSTQTLLIHIGNYDFESNDLGVLIWDDFNGQDLYQVSSITGFHGGGSIG